MMALLNLYKRRADHILYVIEYMFRMKAKNAGTFWVGDVYWKHRLEHKCARQT
jgi:uncharacterized protein YegP (UPF0339 family)